MQVGPFLCSGEFGKGLGIEPAASMWLRQALTRALSFAAVNHGRPSALARTWAQDFGVEVSILSRADVQCIRTLADVFA